MTQRKKGSTISIFSRQRKKGKGTSNFTVGQYLSKLSARTICAFRNCNAHHDENLMIATKAPSRSVHFSHGKPPVHDACIWPYGQFLHDTRKPTEPRQAAYISSRLDFVQSCTQRLIPREYGDRGLATTLHHPLLGPSPLKFLFTSTRRRLLILSVVHIVF